MAVIEAIWIDGESKLIQPTSAMPLNAWWGGGESALYGEISAAPPPSGYPSSYYDRYMIGNTPIMGGF